WGPQAIGDHGPPVSLPKLKKAYEKGTRSISWGPLLTPGPQAVSEFSNGQSTPVYIFLHLFFIHLHPCSSVYIRFSSVFFFKFFIHFHPFFISLHAVFSSVFFIHLHPF
ncbi:unnamed protein product, partial [Staurois parvus]